VPSKEWKEQNLEKMREYRREWYARNKEQEQEKARRRRSKSRQETKKWFKSYKQNIVCKVCGESEPSCLDFHHINPKTKKFSIGSQVQSQTVESLIEEINKCVVLCANCHRKLHAKVIKL
jgi:transcription elongation factor Elf1